MSASLAPPRFEDLGLLVLAGLAKRYTSDKLSLIPVQWADFRAQMGFLHGQIGTKTYGAWFDVLEGGGVFTYFTGAAVGEYAPIHPSFSRVYIQPQRYAVFAHSGAASDIRRTVDAIIGEWLPKSGKQHSRFDAAAPDFFEVYGEKFDPQRGTGDIEIWLPIKK
jgi:AraC family transcriptional regulator